MDLSLASISEESAAPGRRAPPSCAIARTAERATAPEFLVLRVLGESKIGLRTKGGVARLLDSQQRLPGQPPVAVAHAQLCRKRGVALVIWWIPMLVSSSISGEERFPASGAGDFKAILVGS